MNFCYSVTYIIVRVSYFNFFFPSQTKRLRKFNVTRTGGLVYSAKMVFMAEWFVWLLYSCHTRDVFFNPTHSLWVGILAPSHRPESRKVAKTCRYSSIYLVISSKSKINFQLKIGFQLSHQLYNELYEIMKISTWNLDPGYFGSFWNSAL